MFFESKAKTLNENRLLSLNSLTDDTKFAVECFFPVFINPNDNSFFEWIFLNPLLLIKYIRPPKVEILQSAPEESLWIRRSDSAALADIQYLSGL